MTDPSFWQGKRVFITGHTGFKGSWLTSWLVLMEARVKGFSLGVPTTPSLFHIAKLDEVCSEHQIGDIRNYQQLCQAIKTFRPDIVIHMAAQPLVRYSYDNPIETYQSNVMGTVHLLDAIRQVDSVRAVVCVTSDKCYENREWVWGYREVEPMGGYDPYSNSKGCSELVISAYRNSYFNPDDYARHGVAIASARAGNVIGGGDWASDRLIPDVLRAFEQKREVEVRSPNAIRPWQHVLEPLSGYLKLAEQLYEHGADFNGGWNFGPDSTDARTVRYIVDRLAQLWGDGVSWRMKEGVHPHEAHYLKLDCSKATQLLDWHPCWSLSKSLKRIVDWHHAWLAGENMQHYSLNEIRSYIESRDDA
ncbi:CDP-glucose 4,6-dehydratase [Vibrio mangrovi]|uniref:CDP-glucose 4,6-dehydratase n=1 Tax=Vibrio mangrovi TaxID=474394 RepID=A0A1Y6IV17_9VIBR|nr:CDP-glucose 4,6-dehydratase [Vibrio mangrovi]MDW6002172.1 CDP-glucose 4,6-dehydratase [Vibrio mangrovi]SMS01517.1 CDP-glucose 4,6-dehydratase [Vibrio mangrovi]